MSSSVMTPRRQSSATGLQTEDCPSTSPPLTGTSEVLIGARVSTFELQALEANTELNDTHPPRLIDYQPSVDGRHRTRFTLHRLLSAAIPTIFIASKFIDSVHGKALTLNFLDLIPAILVFILFVFSWFDFDPPWLFDTDWDYLLDLTKRGVKDLPRRAKNNPSASLGIIFGVISVLLAITRAISLSRNYQPGGYIDFFDSDCTALALISLPASLMVVGSDRHQRNAYKHAFSMSAILTQLGMLAKWTMGFWISDRPRISETLCYRISLSSLWSITCALGWFTGHYQKLMQTRTFVLAWSSFILVCRSIVSGGTVQRLLNNGGDPNFRRDLTINIGLGACYIILLGMIIRLSLVAALRRY